MLNSIWTILIALTMSAAGALYIRLRWQRSPRAYHAMIALSLGYFIAGVLSGSWILHLAAPQSTEVASVAPSMPIAPPSSRLTDAYLPNRYSGKVVSVTDGDTVDVAIDPSGMVQSVRLAGIDAPETEQTFGAQSTQHLSAVVSGKRITLDCENERSYGRLICKIWLPDGQDVDLDQVKIGMAWHYKQYEDEQSPADRVAYAAAECTAIKSKIGLWADPNPIQPQDFRHGTHSPLLFDSNGCRISSEPTSGPVVGNARTHIFEWPACPYYSSISLDNQVPFSSPQAAEQAGYRPAHNCP
jgi:endonuclease YncB( thermonuclease family)